MRDERNYSKYNSSYERLKFDAEEERYDSCKRNLESSRKYENESVDKNKNAEAEKDFWKLGEAVALIMAFFMILVIVAGILS